nr:uncharacterized protein LOC109978764 isoform X2 [Labrus bergylta]XP_020516972.1 uncharacterized protein LOC110006084 isoform X2 [Labrus bergylta]
MTPERTQRWPDVCPVPAFSYEVELILVEGNLNHERTGKTLKLSRGQKHDILETLASKMHSFKAYPSDKDISVVAEALVTTHPCLKEPGTQTGWYGWKNSLKFKMGNFCTKLSRAGYSEVAVNSGKRSRNNPDKQSPHTDIKRPKRAEVNFLPNFPKGEDGSSLERQRLQIVDEVIRTDKNLPLIAKLMQTTFSLRRKEVINDDLPVGEILEFHRITNINLKNHFYSELDRHVPRLQSLFRKKAARTGKVSEVLDQLFNTYDRQEQVDVNVLRAAVLRALPTYLHEDDSGFLKLWDALSDELQIDNIPVGLLLISATSTDAAVFCPEKVAVVLEAPNFEKPFKLQVDASGVGAGAVLLQEGKGAIDHPVCFFSRKFKRHQFNYSVVEKETLALTWALKFFEVYVTLGSAPVTVFTDQNHLTFLSSMQNSNQRLRRWLLFLQPYNFNICHLKRRDNVMADALSREVV